MAYEIMATHCVIQLSWTHGGHDTYFSLLCLDLLHPDTEIASILVIVSNSGLDSIKMYIRQVASAL